MFQSTGYRACGLQQLCSWVLEHKLNSCDAESSLLHGTWDIPRSGIEPSGFFTRVTKEALYCPFFHRSRISVLSGGEVARRAAALTANCATQL